ncbi:hypothetical protein Ancab_006479 [Ancistrocladus abbreviatus]
MTKTNKLAKKDFIFLRCDLYQPLRIVGKKVSRASPRSTITTGHPFQSSRWRLSGSPSKMVKTATMSRHQEVEDDDGGGDDLAAGTDASSQRDGKSIEQKANNSRSKHSETEQRRRSKINERFQILKDIIPPNDQKRDKASLLLERSNHGPGESFSDHSQVMNNGSGQENNSIQPIMNAHSSVAPGFSGDAAYRREEHPSDAATSAVPLSMPLQSSMYPSGRSVLPAEKPTSQPQSQASLGGPSVECAISGSTPSETSTTNISSIYSQGLLKNLTQAFLTSGVDLSQASISVQLDIGRRAAASLSAVRPATEDIGKVSPSNQSVAWSVSQGGTEDSDPAAKRARTGES